MKYKKILIVRFSSIGDILLTTPVIRCLKKQYPSAEVCYLTKENYKSLLMHNPYLSEIYTIHSSVREVSGWLREKKFDVIIDLHKNIRSYFLWLLAGKKRYSFPKLNVRKWLVVNTKWIGMLPPVHIVERYFEAVKPLEVYYDGEGLDFFISSEDEDFLIDLPEQYYVMVVGAKYATKAIPVEKITEIIHAADLPVVLIGGKEEIIKAKEVEKRCKSLVVNLTGRTSFNLSARIIQRACVVVTPDTGMMHLAAALRKKAIVVWGNTIPAFGMYPLYPAGMEDRYVSFEVEGLPCRPCSKLGYSGCPKKHFYCMQLQETDVIAEHIRKEFTVL